MTPPAPARARAPTLESVPQARWLRPHGVYAPLYDTGILTWALHREPAHGPPC